MSITFEAYTGPADATASVRIPPTRVVAFDGAELAQVRIPPLTVAADVSEIVSVSVVVPPLRVLAFDCDSFGLVRIPPPIVEASEYTAPPVAMGYVQIPALTVRASGSEVVDVVVDVGKPRVMATDAPELNIVRIRAPTVYADDIDPLAGARLVAFQNEGYLTIGGGNPVQRLRADLKLSGSTTQQAIFVLRDAFTLSDKPVSVLQILVTLRDSIDLIDTLSAIFRLLLQSGFNLGGNPTGSYIITAQLIDVLRLTAGPAALPQILEMLASSIAMNDAVAWLSKQRITDTIDISAELHPRLQIAMQLMDTIALDASVPNSITFAAVINDTIAFNAQSGVAGLQVLMQLVDTIDLVATLRIGDSVYYAWVCNPRNKAFSLYTGYGFNSMIEMNGRYFGSRADGIFELMVGDTDDGDDIAWRVRTGLRNLGDNRLKHLPEMFLWYQSSGAVKLIVVTTSEKGDKVGYQYRLAEPTQSALAPREGRIKIGKKLKSVFFDAILEPVDGATLDLAGGELIPLVVERHVRRR